MNILIYRAGGAAPKTETELPAMEAGKITGLKDTLMILFLRGSRWIY